MSLKESGFAEFVPIKAISYSIIPKDKSSIIILADCTIPGKPTSDILYIGKSKKPSKRVFGGYLAGYGGKTTRKINSRLLNDGYMERVSISWIISEDPKLTQQELLEKFKKEHGEYPAWNISKKLSPKPLPKPKSTPKVVKAHPTKK